MDAHTGRILTSTYTIRENYKTAYQLFHHLAEAGINPRAITVDGLPCVLQAIAAVWPGMTIQRCIVHIQRQGLSWLRRQPTTKAAQDLRDLLLSLPRATNRRQQRFFVERFNQWENRYGRLVKSMDSHHKVYSDLQRTRSLIIHALPDMFHFLDDPAIPASTNKIESYFSRLKSIFKRHVGLAKNHRESYFNWYVFLKNNNT